MILEDGTLVNLDNVATSIRINAQRHIDERGTPDDPYSIKLLSAMEYIASRVELNQTIPMNMRTFALKVVYNKREKFTLKQFANILNKVGSIKC